MQLDPRFNDPNAVLVLRSPVPDRPAAESYRAAARHALMLLGLELSGQKVVLKPNVTAGESFRDPDSGIGTHPNFIWGMVDYLKAHGARKGGIYILEDPRNDDTNDPRDWRGTGYPEMAQATGAKLRCPTQYTSVVREVAEPLSAPIRRVSRLAVDPGVVLINVPKLKTHNLAITTLSFKNLMGLHEGKTRHFCSQAMQELPPERVRLDRPREEWMDDELHLLWQEGLARRLVDLARVVVPRLNVVEGVVGRDGTGFQRGTNYPLGLVVAGINMVAVDAAASFLMGFDPKELVYLRMASAAGLGCADLGSLRAYTLVGDNLAPCNLADLRVYPPFRVLRGILSDSIHPATE